MTRRFHLHAPDPTLDKASTRGHIVACCEGFTPETLWNHLHRNPSAPYATLVVRHFQRWS